MTNYVELRNASMLLAFESVRLGCFVFCLGLECTRRLRRWAKLESCMVGEIFKALATVSFRPARTRANRR